MFVVTFRLCLSCNVSFLFYSLDDVDGILSSPNNSAITVCIPTTIPQS